MFYDFFPLTVFKDKILLEQKNKKEIIEYIFKIEKNTKDNSVKRKNDAWLGNSQGHDFLFKNPTFTCNEHFMVPLYLCNRV